MIANIRSAVQEKLAPYSIDVVTERPTSGSYYMFVLGGTGPSVTGNCNGCLSLTPYACAAGVPLNAIDLMFDVGVPANPPGPTGADFYVWTVISDLGAMAGMMLTETANDCECRGGSTCGQLTQTQCELGEDVPVAANQCGVTGTQNEKELLQAKFGCR